MDLSVNIDEIKHDEHRLERALPREWLADVLGGDDPTGFAALGGGHVDARITRLAGSFLLRGEAKVRVSRPCKRCLADVALEVPARFTINLVPDPGDTPRASRDAEEEEGPSGTFESDDADQERMHGRIIDLGRIVREQILLALPMDALCSDACKGLCAVCGNNLNERECGCERRPVDPRWAGLKNIKL